jgi:glycosyltransferase involved in cell wall biosynthesis
MKISVIVPAYNEEKYLPKTLEGIAAALEHCTKETELIVIDNESTDRTAEIALGVGATLICESVHNIGAVRNTGAKAATGEVLVFLDADTWVHETFLARIEELMLDEACFGGSAWADYATFERRKWMRYYPAFWKFWGRVFNMKQGAAQFCRRNAFDAIGGYNEEIFLGEDVDFYWRLTKFARQNSGRLEFIEDIKVITSSRRFDKMSLFKTVVLTHPIFVGLFYKRASVWKDWYENAIR